MLRVASRDIGYATWLPGDQLLEVLGNESAARLCSLVGECVVTLQYYPGWLDVVHTLGIMPILGRYGLSAPRARSLLACIDQLPKFVKLINQHSVYCCPAEYTRSPTRLAHEGL
jgi:hypothetical protein